MNVELTPDEEAWLSTTEQLIDQQGLKVWDALTNEELAAQIQTYRDAVREAGRRLQPPGDREGGQPLGEASGRTGQAGPSGTGTLLLPSTAPQAGAAGGEEVTDALEDLDPSEWQASTIPFRDCALPHGHARDPSVLVYVPPLQFMRAWQNLRRHDACLPACLPRPLHAPCGPACRVDE